MSVCWFSCLLELIFFGEAYPESKLFLLLLRLESDGTGSWSIESGITALVCNRSDFEELDPTDSNDSDGVDGGEDCSLDSSNLSFTQHGNGKMWLNVLDVLQLFFL